MSAMLVCGIFVRVSVFVCLCVLVYWVLCELESVSVSVYCNMLGIVGVNNMWADPTTE